MSKSQSEALSEQYNSLFVPVLMGEHEGSTLFLAQEAGGDTEVDFVMADGAVNLYSKNFLLIRRDDLRTIGRYQSDSVIYPASLTKIMTAILVIEAVDNLDETVILPEKMFVDLRQRDASMAGFLPGEEVCIRDLLYGTLLSSGAEAAVMLADYVAGSESAFAEMMNAKAASLGMHRTHFVNATGLHDDAHVTTVQDLALLLEYALDNKIFRDIFTTGKYQTQPTNLHKSGIWLESTMFSKISEETPILGGKTGYTSQAGLCLASLACIDGEEYILITAGACGDTTTLPYHILDAERIYQVLTIHSGWTE